VAAKAGLSPMAMYRHFADKDGLLNALMTEGLDAWERVARSIRTNDPIRWLEQLMDGFMTFALEQPHRFDAAFFLPAPEARRYPDDFAAGRSPVVAMAVTRIELAKSAGLVGDHPAVDQVLCLAALGQGLVSMHRAGRFGSEEQFRKLYRTTVRHALNSFKTNRGKR